MENILIMILGAAVLPLLFTNDKTVETQESNTYPQKENWRRTFDNMTTSEIDRYLKENYLWQEYGSYSRELKIQKIVERKEMF